MSQFTQHTPDSAPSGSTQVLAETKRALGFVPNLYATFAESPAALNAYAQISAALAQHAALSAKERDLAAIFMSRENDCEYCVAAHTAMLSMAKAPAEEVEAARAGTALGNDKLEALRALSESVIRDRGRVPQEVLDRFYAAGYAPRHVLDVLTLASLKTLSNYTNHIADTPLDAAFAPVAWSKAA